MLSQNKFKHSLCHLLLTLATLGICLLWMNNADNWPKVGSLSDCFVLYMIFVAEIAKVLLSQVYGNYTNESTDLVATRFMEKLSLPHCIGKVIVHAVAVIIYMCGCMVLGASQLDHFTQTFIIALLLTFQTATPIVLMLNASGFVEVVFGEKFRKPPVEAELTTLDLVKYNAVGGVLGAWIGAVVGIANDWQYSWLSYPIPNVYGIVVGSLISNSYGLLSLMYDYYFRSHLVHVPAKIE